MKKYILEKTGEEIMPERWAWAAIYEDGTELKQFDDDAGLFHQIGEVDQSRLKMFVMYHVGNPNRRIDMPFNSDMRLVHKYKNVKPFYLDHFVRVYCFGYNKGDQQHRIFILPDERMIVADHEHVDLPNYELDRQ